MEEKDDIIIDDSLQHINSVECQCQECKKEKSKYIKIIDIDRFVENLNDWD